jgi:hypothetical protein
MSGLPRRGRGRQAAAAAAAYEADLASFCAEILQINSTLDFRVSSRGWGYLLEGAGTITKGDLDEAQRLINDCRKAGLLPLDICAVDDKRAADGLEDLDDSNIEVEADEIVGYAERAHRYYTPVSFWDELPVYLELLVEKIDLKNLFAPVCAEYHVALANGGGWNDIHGRAAIMRRFAAHEAAGRQCVLLYCGDHDPGGLNISDCLRGNFVDLEHAVGWSPDGLIIDRFGLNYDFIESQNLTWIDNSETGSGGKLDDPSHPDHHKPYVQNYLRQFGARKVEANALVVGPAAGRALCQQAIERYLPRDALHLYEARLASMRRALRQAIASRLTGRVP